jgi:predicted alpha/beta hydrolase family esterase
MEDMQHQVLVIHGGTAFSSYEQYLEYLKNKEVTLERILAKDWKSGLEKNLGAGYQVVAPTMPNGSNVHYIEWKIMFEKVLTVLNDEVTLIGHSLGGIFLMKYISDNIINKKIRKMIVVAPPFDNASGEDLREFALDKNALAVIREKVSNIVLFQSRDDMVVPYENALHYKDVIPMLDIRIFEDKGHFNMESFPELVEEIKRN